MLRCLGLMKVLCSECARLFDVTGFRLEGSSLVISCTGCGAELRTVGGSTMAAAAPYAATASPTPSSPSQPQRALVSAADASNVVSLRTTSTVAVEHAARQAVGDEVFTVPSTFCPKCLAPRDAATQSCDRCGVVFAMAPSDRLDVPEWLARAWRELLGSWGDEARHERLRREASIRDGLIDLARLYRLRLALLPDDPFALRGREALLRLATMSITRSSSEDLDRERGYARSRTATIVLAAFGVLLALAAVVILVRMLRS